MLENAGVTEEKTVRELTRNAGGPAANVCMCFPPVISWVAGGSRKLAVIHRGKDSALEHGTGLTLLPFTGPFTGTPHSMSET